MVTTLWHFDMSPNVGNADKVIRFIVGAALIAVTLAIAPITMGWTALLPLVSIPVVISAIVGWDPVYALFQKRRNRIKPETNERAELK